MSQEINLLNPAFRKRREPLSAVGLAQGAAMVLAAILAFYGYARYQVQGLERGAREVETLLKAEQERQAKASAELTARPRQPQLEAELAREEAKLKARSQALQVLESGALGSSEGFAEYLRAFARQKIAGLWLTKLTLSGGGLRMAIEGRALSPDLLPDYINRLNRERVLQGRAFDTLEISRPAAEGAKEGKEAAQPARYLEFTLSTQEAGATSKAGSAGEQTRAVGEP